MSNGPYDWDMTIDQLAELYPDYYEMSGYNSNNFVKNLLAAGLITMESANLLLLTAPAPAAAEQTPAALATDLMLKYPTEYEEANGYLPDFIQKLYAKGYITKDVKDQLLTAAPTVQPTVAAATGFTGKLVDDFRQAFAAVLRSFWEWAKQTLRDIFEAIWNYIKPILQEAWDWLVAQVQAVVVGIYKGFTQIADSFAPLTPEKVTSLVVALYGAAFTAGITAHGISVTTELLHPMKNLGLSQAAAMVGDFAGFSRLAGATVGILDSRIVGQVMTYALQYKFRPRIHNEQMLQTLAIKGDIPIDKFRKLMGYQGYADEYIDDVIRTMYREPSYRELGLMYDAASADDAWLFDKLRRAGYDAADARIFVTSLTKRITSPQRTSYFSQCFYLYREGYIERDRFRELLSRLELRPEAITLALAAADLAYLYDYTHDMVTYYTASYIKDLISKDELLVSLVSIGIIPKRATLMVRKATVQKTPKPAKAVAKALEVKMSALQTKYVQLYQQEYRKGVIDEQQLLTSLLALGLTSDLAEVTVALEAAKRLPAAAGL